MKARKRYNSDSYNDKIHKEEEANLCIQNLVTHIKVLMERKDKMVEYIKYPRMLCRSLTELLSMVEMVNIKNTIVDQIKFLLANKARLENIDSPVFEGHMLHSVISGDPGTGKTTVAKILAKIWVSLGFIKKTVEEKKPDELNFRMIILGNSEASKNWENLQKIKKLEEANQDLKNKLFALSDMLSVNDSITNIMRLSMITMKTDDPDVKPYMDVLLKSVTSLKYNHNKIMRTIAVDTRHEKDTRKELITPILSQEQIEDPFEDKEPPFIIAQRQDLIGEYLGSTAPKTKKVLESARGGVLFIDEAYSLCTIGSGSKDMYGEECLVAINEFMSIYPDEIVVIFGGYKEKLMETIFRVQPGLLRRISNYFTIDKYSNQGLAKIFKKQLAKNNWKLDESVDIVKVFTDNKDIIVGEGGFTEKLSLFVKIAYGQNKFNESFNANANISHDSIITGEMVEKAITNIRANMIHKEEDPAPPFGMYT